MSHGGMLTVAADSSLLALIPSPRGGITCLTRNPADPPGAWSRPVAVGSGPVRAVSASLSGFGAPHRGSSDAVANDDGKLVHYWREREYPHRWTGPEPVADGVHGSPVIIHRATLGIGHLELLTPLADGGIAHFRRATPLGFEWRRVATFAAALGRVEALAVVRGNFGISQPLDLLARIGDRLALFHWSGGLGSSWEGPHFFFEGAAGQPGICQGRRGLKGHYEVLTPLAAGGLAHLWRNNDSPAHDWTTAARFGNEHFHSAGVADGGRGLEAVAAGEARVTHFLFDAAHNTWSPAPQPIHDDAADDPGVAGEWRIEASLSVVGIHAALLPTGRVLLFAFRGESHIQGDSCVFDPHTRAEVRVPIHHNVFCSGQCQTGAGELLIAGGHGLPWHVDRMHSFHADGAAGAWHDLEAMPAGRWYPTCTTLPDGRVLVLGGSRESGKFTPEYVNATLQVYDPALAAPPRLGPVVAASILRAAGDFSLYPFVFVLPDGRLLVHANTTTAFLDPGTLRFAAATLTTNSPEPRNYPLAGSAVLLTLRPPDYRAQVLLVGGGRLARLTPGAPVLIDDMPASDSCELLDLGMPEPRWHAVAPLQHARVMPDAVLLPDGSVFVLGGSARGRADHAVHPVFASELFDPVTRSWRTLANMRVPRLYHSTALLLPDGRVLAAGKDSLYNPAPYNYPELRVEIFSPPYLFRGARPRVTAAPTQLAFGETFDVRCPDAGTIRSAVLMRCGAVTHSFNMDQRSVALDIRGAAGDRVSLTAPPNGAVAPPGAYMLFLLNAAGVPSIAPILRLA